MPNGEGLIPKRHDMGIPKETAISVLRRAFQSTLTRLCL